MKRPVVAAIVLMSFVVLGGVVGNAAKRLEYQLMIKNGKDVYRQYVMVSVNHGRYLVNKMEKIANSQGTDLSNLSESAELILYNISMMNISRESLPEINRKWDSFEAILVEMSRKIIADRIRINIQRLENMHPSGEIERELVNEKISKLRKLLVDINYMDPWLVGGKADEIINGNRKVIIDTFEAYGNGEINITLDAGVIELNGKGKYWAKGGEIEDRFEDEGYVRVEGRDISLNFSGEGKVVARGMGIAYVHGSGYYKSSYREGAWPTSGYEKITIAGD